MRTSETVNSRQRVTGRDARSAGCLGQLAQSRRRLNGCRRRKGNPSPPGDAVHRDEQGIVVSTNRFGELANEWFQRRRIGAVVGFGAPDHDGEGGSSEWVADRGRHRIDIDVAADQDLANPQRTQAVSVLYPTLTLLLVGGDDPLR